MDTQAVAWRILQQRMGRYTDGGPSLGAAGSARYRMEAGRLRVAYATARPGHTGELVEGVVRYARMRRAQVQWTVTPTRSGEEQLTPALLAAGFEAIECLLLMAHEGPIGSAVNPRVEVRRIASWQEMWEYEVGSRQSFYDDLRPSDALVSQRATERWREHERGWCHYYKALLGGRHAGGCYVSLFEDVPTIMGVYTLREARRQGVATALLARTVRDLLPRENGLCCLFVEDGNPAERLYRRLGFVPLFESNTYNWTLL
jgi:GNAT superfamily N-acetyltransferase